MVHCIHRGVAGFNFQIISYFFLIRSFWSLIANSADPDDIPHSVTFHLGLTICQHTHLGIFSLQRVKGILAVCAPSM